MMVTNPSFWRILFPWILWKGPTELPEVFLTFDDGPHPIHTPRVLDILKHDQTKATFFLVGEKILLYPEIVERINKEGHTIGNHGFFHHRLTFQRAEKIRKQILETDDAIEKITGQKPLFFRPPHGRFDPRFRRLMKELQHRMVLWSLLSYDFRESDPRKLIRRIQENLHPGAIVVLHDGHPNSQITLEALLQILSSLRRLGYRMKPLNTLIGKVA